MLTELYRYALDKGLSAKPGFKPKRVKAYVLLSADGKFLSLETRDKKAPAVYAPDIGTAANGTRFCNPLIEKAKIPLGLVEDEKKDKNIPTKHDFFLSMLDGGADCDPKFAAAAAALRDPDTVQQITDSLATHKLKPADPIGFQVDGCPLEQGDAYLPWWEEFRTMFAAQASDTLPRCLITGELAPALETVPKVSGLIQVGGHTAGDAFLCFDKDAFRSYGLKQSANAPVSEQAMTAVNAALTDLIARAPTLGNAKQVHWYSREVAAEDDPFELVIDTDWDSEPVDTPAPEKQRGTEKEALRAASRLHSAIFEGCRPELADARYYIMPLSGANGRMMVRGWYEGDYKTLHQNIIQWFDDLALVTPDGKGMTRPPKLKALCTRLLKPGGDPAKVWSRIDDELPSLVNRLLYAIINGSSLPDEVAVRALRWIRSAMLQSDEANSFTNFDRESLAFQLLKAWLCRKQRLRGDAHPMEAAKSETRRNTAYYCGQLMATYVAIQRRAMPEVGVGVAERFYTAASTNPAFVIGKLAQLSQHHLNKLDAGLAVYYERLLSEIYMQIGETPIPATLNAEQQTEFALGYYQQRAALYSNTSNAENKGKE